MGLGVHGGGLGVARWLLQQGAQVTVTDVAEAGALAESVAALDASAAALGAQVNYVLGEHRAEDFATSQMVVANAAVRPDSPWLAHATEAGVPIETEMTLFFRACPGPILGVTGTKGKTTTALLLAAMLRRRHPATLVAGNLRVSALEALPTLNAKTPVVLELSSFQLERLGAAGLSPHYSLVTNISSDHVNWHGSIEAYAAAKRQIYWHQASDGIVALNGADDGSVEHMMLYEGMQRHGGRTIWVCAGPHWSRARSRFLQPVVRSVDTSVERRGDTIVWRDVPGYCGSATPLAGEPLFSVGDIRIPGAHNLANAMCAAALARAFDAGPADIRAALRTFNGVEHRLELVREFDGVHYVNDTTATNPAAALAALDAFATPIVLIAGGADKELEFSALGAAIARRVKALVLLEGSATSRMVAAVQACAERSAVPTLSGPYADFGEALDAARGLAEAGDTVLLSPGCASFGMFRNEFHRGEEFRQLVANLSSEKRQRGRRVVPKVAP
ncbi:MAG: UDP-N-acetylmuramoyl-L-alanine--D-glutamate ligase [Candidatus Viridilinea halotolerans]|uniref:UDP-N-acetylmuramoylalanine--D-glutamate ligase n=1 Tax=Candidatus Viridilinea halotolerans TaxID=2491704 RepID=A0A426U5Z2_9CHLR|nr:MAG: UDP-N-acetylmuramoyl-L-alanine--D-glutamate ligase [Candidatus Viridilinea halotolerans]